MANPSKKPTASRPVRPAKRPVVEQIAEIPARWVIAAFALITLVFFWGHISGGAFLWEDFTEFTYPNEVFAARNFAAGVVPFWNPYTFNGMPFLADLQIGFFYPANLLMYLFSGGELSTWLGQFFIVLHYLVAMIGMWKLARGFGIGSWGALFAGISYALSGMMVVHMIHPNMVHHLAWFPLITYFFHRGVSQRSLRHSLLAGLVLGLVLLSGHPQSALYMVVYLFALTVFVVVRDMRAGKGAAGEAAAAEAGASTGGAGGGSLVMALVAAAIPIVVGVGIFAVQLLPSQELAGLSERAEMTYEKSLEGAMGAGQLITLVVPKFFGVAGPAQPAVPFWYRQEPYYFWETAAYIGVVTLILAAIGLASGRLGGLGWFLGGMGLFGLLYALGDSFFVHPLVARLPLFGTFRIPTRLAIYLAFGGSLLAGAGLERLLRGGEDGGRSRRALLIVGGGVVAIGLLTVAGVLGPMFNVPEQIASSVGSAGLVALLVGGGATLVAFMMLKGRFTGLPAAALLVLLGTVDLFAFGFGQNNSKDDPGKIYADNDEAFAAFKASSPDSLYRIKMRDDRGMLMQRNQGQYSNIMLYEGYNPLLLKRRVPPGPDIAKRLDLLNVAYEVKVDSTTGQAGMVERPGRYAHARMVYDVRVVPGEEELTQQMTSGQADFGRTVFLEEEPAVKPDGSGTGQAKITRYSAESIDVSVNTDKPGILVLSEIWYPAWQVTIDGAPAKLLRANYSLRGVAVPAGKHTVALRFSSSAFATGLWITIGTLVASIGALVVLTMRARSAKVA